MKFVIVSSLFFALLSTTCLSQDAVDNTFRVMFYNVENYFDSNYDSLRTYNEFTPDGDIHWTYSKYKKKRNSIYKVIKAVGEWRSVTLIGLAEIENEFVISDLIENTPLYKDRYKFVHFDSDDFRGIDVALLYQSDSFTLLFSEKVPIRDPDNPEFKTRDMLYVVGLMNTDTLHVVINHWTSRYRGYLESEPLRVLAANILLKLTDSICAVNKNANILLMGDFNDNAENTSMQLLTNDQICGFRNMKLESKNPGVGGTLKYKSEWSGFDQILVTNSIFKGNNGLHCTDNAKIFDADFLLEEDLQYLGLKTNRTNIGFKYHGGFSDHLPVYIDIESTR